MKNYIKVTEVAEEVKQYDSGVEGLNVTIFKRTHGNEASGDEIVEDIEEYVGEFGLKSGKLTVGTGNPEAAKLTKRYTQRDLNRAYGLHDKDVTTYEGKRSKALKPVLAKTDLFFDLHNTILDADPMVLATSISHKLAGVLGDLGIATLIYGEGMLPPSWDPIYGDSFVGYNGGLGITVEAGGPNTSKPELVSAGIIKALKRLGVLHKQVGDRELSPVSLMGLEVWHAVQNIVASEGFAFTKPWENFEPIAKGEVYAKSESGLWVSNADGAIIFPKPQGKIVVGEEACILVEKVMWVEGGELC